MKVVRTLGPLQTSKPAVVIAIGFFDGVHLGHQSVIDCCREQAAAFAGEAWAMTFDPHPIKVLRPHAAPRLITSLETKLDIMSGLGIDGVIVAPFTGDFSHQSPRQFLDHLHEWLPALRGIVVGQNWRFGYKAEGNTTMLRELAPDLPFAVTIAGPRETSGLLISSSRIREAITAGRLDEAAAMLGRRHVLRGRVIDGLKRGRHLGFPTANLDLTGYVLPPSGIYAARVQRAGHAAAHGAVYLSENPAIEPGLLEVHLIDFEGDLYGQELTIELVKKIRDDNLRFENEHDLIRQIAADVANIRQMLQCHE